MAITALLVELYSLSDLKLNLKFEIEVLCKNLGQDIKEMTPSGILKDIKIINTTENPDFTSLHVEQSTPVIRPSVAPATTSPSILPLGAPRDIPPSISPLMTATDPAAVEEKLQQPVLPVPAVAAAPPPVGGSPQLRPATAPQPFSEQNLIPGLVQNITVNREIALFQHAAHAALKRCIPPAIDRAIREIITPVVERSVTIACITTRELVLKDFAMEPDETKMRKAAHLTVRNLSGSLSLVTCKEPLRVSMCNQLRNILQQQMQSTGHLSTDQQHLIEQAVQVVCNDNLELGCAFIEKAAMEKAIRDIDEALQPAYAVRRTHREQDQPYYDMSVLNYVGRYPNQLPEPLCPKPGGLQPMQLQVYEDFARMHSPATVAGVAAAQQAAAASAGTGVSTPASVGGMPARPPGMMPAAGGADTHSIQRGLSISDLPLPMQAGSHAVHSVGAMQRPVGPPSQAPIGPPVHVHVPIEPVEEKLSNQQCIEKVNSCLAVLEHWNQRQPSLALSALSVDHEVLQQLRKIPQVLQQSVTRDETALAIAQRIFKRLYETDRGLSTEMLLAVLDNIKDVCKKLVKELTSWLIYSDEERKLYREITTGFLSLGLINTSEFDPHMAKLMDNGRNQAVVEFNMFLVSYSLIGNKDVTQSEFYNILNDLGKIAARAKPPPPEGLQALLEDAHQVKDIPKDEKQRAKDKKSAGSKPKDFKAEEPAWLRDQVALFFDQWLDACNVQSEKAYAPYISDLQRQGMLKGDEMTDRFFRLLLELATERYAAEKHTHAIDALAKLIVLLIKYADGATGMPRVTVVSKVFLVTQRSLLYSYESKRYLFDQRPWYRFLSMLLEGVNSLTNAPTNPPEIEQISLTLLTNFSNILHHLNPANLPGFSFAWLELVSHRLFMPKLLGPTKPQKGWQLFQRLLVDLFKFLEPYLRNAEMTGPVQLLYTGTLRVLLVLLHDFPEFLCDYHFSFCDYIPPSCIQVRLQCDLPPSLHALSLPLPALDCVWSDYGDWQMRNLVLSAFPRNMRLPDPFTPNLKVDLLPEILQPPRILST
jgi:CCR4-NOT transcription complex subunit 1